MSRSKPLWGAAVALGIAAAAFIEAPGLTQPRPSGRIVWRGEWRHRVTRSAGWKQGRAENVATFETIQEPDQDGNLRDVSHTLTWNLSGFASLAGAVVVDRPMAGRRRGDWSSTCLGQGRAVRLGDSPEERDRFESQLAAGKTRCVEDPAEGVFGTFGPGTWYSAPRNFGPVPWEQLRDSCEFATRSRYYSDGALIEETVRITVSAPVPAVMEVDPKGEYGRFVPVPGETLTFVARAAGTARFRFELDPEATSRFPGYATNANVDDVFFVKYKVGHLRSRYANDGPDVIFDAKNFGRGEWSRIEPLVVETRSSQSGAVVTVTAMDFGAVGKLRAFVKSEECGDWQPVPVRFGNETRESVSIPLDEDNNLIADALEAYRGRDSGADDDAEPKGNGMAGDGLTAFEEYRGFLVRGAGCPVPPAPGEPGEPAPEPFPREEGDPSGIPGWDDVHIRTTPRHKNFFVHTLDPELAVLTDDFAWATDLSVHVICEPHYVDNDTRIINFTLQQAGMREWRGKRISQDYPQHGTEMLAVDYPPYGSGGAAEPVDLSSNRFGPPTFWQGALIYKPVASRVILALAYTGLTLRMKVTHELAHIVGVPHHSDRVESWRNVPGKANVWPTTSVFQRSGGTPPRVTTDETDRAVAEADLGGLLVLGTDCDEWLRMYRDGRFVGCAAVNIARRGQQNSGDFECPMRYVAADYYEPPGSTAVYRWTGYVSGPGPGPMTVDAWEGDLLKYRNDLDREGMGKLCTRTRGTGINALPGNMNHSGDAGRDKSCAEFLVVNDVTVRGVR